MSGPARRSQQERAATTRARILEAAFSCLVDSGYGATTVGAVQERAGVARGTLLHHFPTRSALMAGVVEDVVERRLVVLTAAPTSGAPSDGWDAVVDLVWRELRGPAYAAALELWIAARTDDDLRRALVPLQERLFASVHGRITALVGADHPRAPLLVQFTIDLLTGSHLAGILQPRAGTDVVVDAWKAALRVLAAAQEPLT
ncbi:TetR/AcrR family transcriptional regulator [Nocardioides sp.]|uniref:TetR/AcrR family transcriptional regulator n=1 Tax=Nocardioides sp. TaxID=35761 RepID=UPI003516AA23